MISVTAPKNTKEKQRQVLQLILALDKRIEASPYFLPTLLVLLVALLMQLRGHPLITYVVARWSLRARRAGKFDGIARRPRIPRNAAPPRKARLEESRIANAPRIRRRNPIIRSFSPSRAIN